MIGLPTQHNEIRRLNAEIIFLRQQLAERYGRQRAEGLLTRHVEDTSTTTNPSHCSAPAGKLQMTVNTKIRELPRMAYGFKSPKLSNIANEAFAALTR